MTMAEQSATLLLTSLFTASFVPQISHGLP